MATQGKVKYSPQEEQGLMARIWRKDIKDDPYAFVMFAFPWGKKGTPLEHVHGPRAWQKRVLIKMRDHIAENKIRAQRGEPPQVLQVCVGSGRGIGKSALVSMIICWMMSCVIGSTTIVTANTESQLKDKTWGEVGKWFAMLINSHWFDKAAMSVRPADWFKQKLADELKVDTGYYYAQAQTWSEENPDAFAGAHNMNGILEIMDEASGIPTPIWTVSEGFFTEPTIYRFWFAFSNPRRNTGAFFECFHKMRDFWWRLNIDARTVEGTDKSVYDKIIAKYGEDSDEVRVEVKGQFPKQGDSQFIGRDTIQAAVERELFEDEYAGLIMGVDPARFGADSSVIYFRRGRDGRSIPAMSFKGKDNMWMANKCAEMIEKYKPDAVCVDAGNGTGIIDRLREMGYKVHEVWFGAKSEDEAYANKRTELWGRMRDWLKEGCIPQEQELMDDLAGPEYDFNSKDQIMLESKEKMKSRGLSSPDIGDALACTFAVKVARKDSSLMKGRSKQRVAKDLDYGILG